MAQDFNKRMVYYLFWLAIPHALIGNVENSTNPPGFTLEGEALLPA
jgi:hypothetical protein